MASVEGSEYVDGESGEVFALVSLATWQSIVRLAAAFDPCELSSGCGATACALARRVLAEERRRNV